MIKKTFIIFLTLFILGCSKNESALMVGKWYTYSLDTKKSTGTGCNLKDTTKYYTKGLNANEYEFFSDGTGTITLYNGGTTYKSPITYTFSNNNLNISINGTAMPAPFVISNISSEGWRYQQDNFIWCPSKTAFIEYYNFKKY